MSEPIDPHAAESRRERQLRIWRGLTPAQRDYDRYVGRIPEGASWRCETEAGQRAIDQRDEERERRGDATGCSCHISAPCSYCTREEGKEASE